MIFAVFDPSPLTLCINYSFYIYINKFDNGNAIWLNNRNIVESISNNRTVNLFGQGRWLGRADGRTDGRAGDCGLYY